MVTYIYRELVETYKYVHQDYLGRLNSAKILTNLGATFKIQTILSFLEATMLNRLL